MIGWAPKAISSAEELSMRTALCQVAGSPIELISMTSKSGSAATCSIDSMIRSPFITSGKAMKWIRPSFA